MMDNKCSGLISPKGLRTAANVFLIIISVLFVISSAVEYDSLPVIKRVIINNPQLGILRRAVDAISGEAASLLIIGMIALVFGIVCIVKNKDGFAHKKCFVLALASISLFTVLISIFDGLFLVNYGEPEMSIINFVGAGLAVISTILFVLCWLEGKKSGSHEKLFGILGSVCLLFIRILTSSATIFDAVSQYSPNIVGTVLGAMFGLAIYVIFLMYFIKLHDYSEVKNDTTEKPYGNYSVSDTSFQVDILTKYKDLLDRGVITQEEFDAKKNEILNQK